MYEDYETDPEELLDRDLRWDDITAGLELLTKDLPDQAHLPTVAVIGLSDNGQREAITQACSGVAAISFGDHTTAAASLHDAAWVVATQWTTRGWWDSVGPELDQDRLVFAPGDTRDVIELILGLPGA